MKFWFYKKSNEKKTNCKNKNQIKRKDKFNGYYEIYEILEGWHKKKRKKKEEKSIEAKLNDLHQTCCLRRWIALWWIKKKNKQTKPFLVVVSRHTYKLAA
jgi:hypothetical protein